LTKLFVRNPLIIIKDESGEEDLHGNIAGAFYKIPSTEDGSITQEFDIHFGTIQPYGMITVGLSSREDTGKMQITFYRGDLETFEKYHSQIQGARGTVLFGNSDGIMVNATPEVSFNEGRIYHIEMKYRKGEYVQVVVRGKDEEGLFKLWDSGKLKVTGKANFNRVYFGVRSYTGSDIHYDKDAKRIFLKGTGAAGGGNFAPLIVFVDNMVIKYEE